MIYKFSPADDCGLENIQRRSIFCRHFSDFNDPFEFWSRFQTFEGIPEKQNEPERYLEALKAWGFSDGNVDYLEQETIDEYFEAMEESQIDFPSLFENLRIACFGTDPSNLLLWAHYAEGLRGFCVVFDEDILSRFNETNYLAKVNYTDKSPAIDSFLYAISSDQFDFHMMAIDEYETEPKHSWPDHYRGAADTAMEQMHSMWQKAFATKPVEWEYEREKRLLTRSDSKGFEPIFLQYPKEALKEILVGERMPDGYRESLSQVVSEIYGNIPIRTARRSSESYKILIE
ncbi:MAG: DUF2971 domain-containing protein [Rhodospirillales bacterium]|nr:DUF2971 domain-containing protein [Rhodospirillales bacterium]